MRNLRVIFFFIFTLGVEPNSNMLINFLNMAFTVYARTIFAVQ